jgi:hypothetical protein
VSLTKKALGGEVDGISRKLTVRLRRASPIEIVKIVNDTLYSRTGLYVWFADNEFEVRARPSQVMNRDVNDIAGNWHDPR